MTYQAASAGCDPPSLCSGSVLSLVCRSLHGQLASHLGSEPLLATPASSQHFLPSSSSGLGHPHLHALVWTAPLPRVPCLGFYSRFLLFILQIQYLFPSLTLHAGSLCGRPFLSWTAPSTWLSALPRTAYLLFLSFPLGAVQTGSPGMFYQHTPAFHPVSGEHSLNGSRKHVWM